MFVSDCNALALRSSRNSCKPNRKGNVDIQTSKLLLVEKQSSFSPLSLLLEGKAQALKGLARNLTVEEKGRCDLAGNLNS